MEALRRYPVVTDETLPGDPMWDGGNYLMLGRAGLDVIRLALLCAQKAQPASVLDFASGYGRVTRFLAAEYPTARLAACDIDRRSVDFCAERFGSEPIYGHENPAQVEFGEPFDLVWVGSLLTHLPEPGWGAFFDFFERAVAPGGLLVFTFQGRAIAKRLRDEQFAGHYLGDRERNAALAESVRETGFAFTEYGVRGDRPHPSSYGVSLCEPWWVWKFLGDRPDWLVVSHMEGRWGAQDVVGALRTQEGLRTMRHPLRHPNRD